MTYLRSFVINLIIIFLINRIVPGVEVGTYQQVPNIGADLLFSAIVALLNASVFPVLASAELDPGPRTLAVVTFLISFAAYITIAIFPFGVQAVTPFGVILASTVTWVSGFLTNYFEWRQEHQE